MIPIRISSTSVNRCHEPIRGEPLRATGGAEPVDSCRFLRESEFLMVRAGAELSDGCMVGNDPVDSGGWRRRVTISWNPSCDFSPV